MDQAVIWKQYWTNQVIIFHTHIRRTAESQRGYTNLLSTLHMFSSVHWLTSWQISTQIRTSSIINFVFQPTTTNFPVSVSTNSIVIQSAGTDPVFQSTSSLLQPSCGHHSCTNPQPTSLCTYLQPTSLCLCPPTPLWFNLQAPTLYSRAPAVYCNPVVAITPMLIHNQLPCIRVHQLPSVCVHQPVFQLLPTSYPSHVYHLHHHHQLVNITCK